MPPDTDDFAATPPQGGGGGGGAGPSCPSVSVSRHSRFFPWLGEQVNDFAHYMAHAKGSYWKAMMYPTWFEDDDFDVHPTFYRHIMPPRSIVQLADLEKSDKFGISKRFFNDGRFKILTYNILWNVPVQRKTNGCPEWARKWEYRRVNLLDEIVRYGADIVCLQEVQDNHFESFFNPNLAEFGYSAIYKAKTDALYTSEGRVTDGCAIFFKNDVFKEVTHHEIEFCQTALSLIERLEVSQRQEAEKRLIKRNIALLVILEVVGDAHGPASSRSKLCVVLVNTHIYAGERDMHPGDVQLLQVSDLINKIEDIIDPGIPLLICGDMNSTPGSYPYVLLTEGEVNPVAHDQLNIFPHLKLHHSRKLASAYPSLLKSINSEEGCRSMMIDPETGEPLFTYNGKRTLDYIFYTADSLEVEGLLGLPDYDSVAPSLPSPAWSSDHIALMACFRIK